MFEFKINTLKASVSPLYYISKILGLAPFVIEANQYDLDGSLSVLYSCFIVCCICGLCSHHLYHFCNYVYIHESNNYMVSDICSKVLIYGTAFLGVIMAVVYRKTLSMILEKISRIDNKLTLPSEYVKNFWMLILQIVLSNSLIVVIFVVSDIASSFDFTFVYYEAFAHVLGLIVVLQFINIVQYIKYLYKLLNDKLYSDVGENVTVYKGNFPDLPSIYKDLQECLEHVNICFSWQIIWVTGSCFIQLVTSLHDTITEIRSSSTFTESDNRLELIICQVLQILYYTSILLAISISGQTCTREANRILTVVHKLLLNKNLTRELSAEFESFVMYYNTYKLKVTANDVFPVDMSLFQMVIAAVFIYLAILLQF